MYGRSSLRRTVDVVTTKDITQDDTAFISIIYTLVEFHGNIFRYSKFGSKLLSHTMVSIRIRTHTATIDILMDGTARQANSQVAMITFLHLAIIRTGGSLKRSTHRGDLSTTIGRAPDSTTGDVKIYITSYYASC